MSRLIACLCVLVFACFAQGQESISERLSRLEANTGAMLARLKSDVADLRADVKALGEKVDAVAKVAAPGSTFKASTVNEWGDGQRASFSESVSYSSIGAGNCVGGNCSVPRFFGRLRR